MQRSAPRRRIILAVSVIVALAAGCASAGDPVEPEARAIVDRLREATSPTRWSFRYRLDSASDYVACLGGLDRVSGVMDLDVGALMVQPDREAPAVIVTESAFMVAGDSTSGTSWREVSWNETDDVVRLVPIFGEVLAGYIATGLRTPDLNMTTVAALDIADAVNVAAPATGVSGDALRITVNPARYLAEIESQGAVSAEDSERIPTLMATVDNAGLVTAVTVDATPPADPAVDHRDRYVVTAGYDDPGTLSLPGAAERSTVQLDDLDYPTPEQSCQFRP